MSVVAGIFKGLGMAGMIVGPILLVVGLIVLTGAMADAQSCAEREDSFDRCNDAEGEVLLAKLVGSGSAAGAGLVLTLLGSLFYFVARGTERRAEARQGTSPLPPIDDGT